MKNIFALRDAKAEAFLVPFFVESRGVALRSVSDAVNRPQEASPISQHPEDFALFFLGLYDETNGSLLPATQPEMVVGLLELKDSK